jgi:type II secretory pathway pseudopilin PulG
MRRAFTLVETLLALALVALLSGSIFGFLAALSERRRDQDKVVHREEGASVLCEQLEAGLLCAICGDAKIGPGVKGDESSIRLISRGVRLPAGKDAAKPASDLVVTEFAFDAGAAIVRARRWEVGTGETSRDVLIEQVKSLKIRYRDRGEWVDSYDSTACDGLPQAVEISLWFGEPAHPEAGSEKPVSPSDSANAPLPDRTRLIALADGRPSSDKEGKP